MTIFCDIALGTFFFLFALIMFISLVMADDIKNKRGLLDTTYAIAIYLFINSIIFTISSYFFIEAFK